MGDRKADGPTRPWAAKGKPVVNQYFPSPYGPDEDKIVEGIVQQVASMLVDAWKRSREREAHGSKV